MRRDLFFVFLPVKVTTARNGELLILAMLCGEIIPQVRNAKV
jgi:hypothetical protein